MANLSAANLVAFTDKLTAEWLAAIGTDATTYGLGTTSASSRAYKKAQDYIALIMATSDGDYGQYLAAGANVRPASIDAINSYGPFLVGALADLDKFAKAAGLTGVTDLATFATYYNFGSGGNNTCLLAPDFATAYYAAKKSYPAATVCYFEILQGATYTNALAKWVISGAGTGALTVGTGIVYNSTTAANFAGGLGQVKSSGISGSGVVTVTGLWRAADGTVSSAAGTATVSSDTTTVLTPPSSNALLLTVTAISCAAGLTAGTIYAEAKRPTARTNPPT